MKTRTLEDGKVIGPLSLKCPACQSPAGNPCTQPTEDGRRNVQWFHESRIKAVDDVFYDQGVCHYDVGYHVNPHTGCFLR